MPASGEATVDLHGYTVETALAVADRIIKEAYRQGYTSVTFIHGGAGTHSAADTLHARRGAIKWALKDMVSSEWRLYVRGKRHRGHKLMAAYSTLALQANPSPALPRRGLGNVPPPDYGRAS